MAKNEILPFGIGVDANVLTPAEYEALAARIGGFSSGVAKSEQLNTVWRQSAFITSVLAQFIANRTNKDVLDDGGTAALLTNLELAIKTYVNSNLPAASTTVVGAVKLSNETNSNSELLAATPKAVKTVSDAALKSANNLSEIKAAGPSAVAAAIANLGLTDTAATAAGALQKMQNLNDVANKTTALTNLGALPANGTAAAATKLATARNIAGKPFDGTANITIGAVDVGALASNGTAAAATKLATARNIAGKPFDGTANITIGAVDVGALASNGTAAAATKLATARNIAGKPFDGTANITIGAVDVGALASNGTAAAATKLATARNIAGKPFDGTANITIGAADVGALPIAGGALTGPLAINGTHSEPLGPGGYRSCLLTPANGGITNPGGAGIGLHSSGVIYFWNDSLGYAADLSPVLMSFRRPIASSGTITPSDYANFDARYSKFGAGQSWTDVLSGRVSGTWYTNNTGKPIMISVTTDYGPNAALNCQTGSAGTIAYPRGGGSEYIQHNATFIVVPGDTYRVTAAGTIGIWKELR
ncbi:phage tail protein [Yersinia rochesterensis]|uniref:phage tail protein n=1 Tax=Yersinia rochesterensis TaxID=1604335 RepID=UPI0011A7E903|nr:phage tail protein [Yersinia rochesterensis]